jgi:hypothetical protein
VLLGQERRRAEEESLKARRTWWSRTLSAPSPQESRDRQAQKRCHHDERKSGKSGHLRGASVQCLGRGWAFFLGKQLGYRGLMRNRILALVKRKFVLKTPTKNREGKHEEPEG